MTLQNTTRSIEEREIRIFPIGGLGEIGMNCMVIESKTDLILVDCGLMFSDLAEFGVQFIMPDLSYVLDRKDKLRGIILTHGHEDHIGALVFALKTGLQVPLYSSLFTSMLIRSRLDEAGLLDRTTLHVFKLGESFALGGFQVETVPVNHSIVDAAALVITTPAGKIIHTGDFRIDPGPYFGKPLDLDVFRKHGDDGVLLLMSDSTNVEVCEHSKGENVITQSFEELFARAQGLTVVTLFASNVARMSQVFDQSRKMGKKVALLGRSMDQNSRHAREAGYLKGYEDLLIPSDSIDDYPRDQVVVLSTGCQGEFGSALNRMAWGESQYVDLRKGDLVLFSSKFIPGNEVPISRLINQIFKQGAEVLYESIHDLHVSGHATRPELKQMLEAVRPKYFIPVHGEYRHLVHHCTVAREAGLKDAQILLTANGDLRSFTANRTELLAQVESTRVMVEDRSVQQVSKDVLRDRRKLGEMGVIFVLAVQNRDDLKVISGPEVITRGVVAEDLEAWMIDEAKLRLKEVVRTYHQQVDKGAYQGDLTEMLRLEMRRFFNLNLGKKPIIIPIILSSNG